MGTFESTKITAALVDGNAFDLCDHLVDVSCRIGIAGGGTNESEFLGRITQRFLPPRHRERLANPCSNGQMTCTGQTLDFPVFAVLKYDLKTLSHVMSLDDSL